MLFDVALEARCAWHTVLRLEQHAGVLAVCMQC